jgi:hypothetical protein
MNIKGSTSFLFALLQLHFTVPVLLLLQVRCSCSLPFPAIHCHPGIRASLPRRYADSLISHARLKETHQDDPRTAQGYRRKLLDAHSTTTATPVIAVQASPTFFLRTRFQHIDLPKFGHVILGDIAANIKLQVRCSNHITSHLDL